MSTQLEHDNRRVEKLRLACLREGITNIDIHELCRSRLLGRIGKVIRGEAEINIRKHIIDCDTNANIPMNWKILDQPQQLPSRFRGKFVWDKKKVRFYQSQDQIRGRRYIQGHALVDKLYNKPVFGAQILDYLIQPAMQQLIPEQWKAKAIFFWGTIYEDCSGNCCVRRLLWDEIGWRCDFYRFFQGWGENDVALISSS